MAVDTKIMHEEKQELVRSWQKQGYGASDMADALLLSEMIQHPESSDQPDWIIQRRKNLRQQVTAIIYGLDYK
jgi:hypothetical protein